MKKPFWEESYNNDDASAFGIEPNPTVQEMMHLYEKHWRILDVGCGEGKNGIYLATKGFGNIDAIDISEAGIAKLRRLAKRNNVLINAYVQDLCTFEFSKMYDLIMTHGTLHLVTKGEWHKFLEKAKLNTNSNGIHIIRIFTNKLLRSLTPVLVVTAITFAGVHYVSPDGTATWEQSVDMNTPCSLPTANANGGAGDTVYLRGGAYSDIGSIKPANSGTSENARIVYCNYSNEKPVIRDATDGIYLYKKSYITVSGIEFENLNRFLRIYAGHYNTIGYCAFNQRKSTSGEWTGCLIADDFNDTTAASENSTYNRVHHCSFFRWVYGAYAEHRGGMLDIGSWTRYPADESYYNCIEHNTFAYGGHHTLGVYSRYNVIRNNYFHNETNAAQWAFAGYRDAITEGPVGGYCLYEYNRYAFADSASALALRTHHNILRFNMFYHNGLGGIQAVRSDTADCADSNHIYHNVFYRNGYGADYSGFSGGVYFCDWGNGDPTGNALKNNIFHDNKGGAITTDAVATPQIVERNWEAGDPLFVDDESPLDTLAPTLPDFHLQATSRCIDSGTFLTVIVTPAGNGQRFQLEDAAYFTSGWDIPGVAGDEIQLWGTAQKARITDVDYQTNTVSVDKSLTWTQNQGVCLAYQGAAPDLGAYEYSENSVIFGPGTAAPGKRYCSFALYNLQGRKIGYVNDAALRTGSAVRRYRNGVYFAVVGQGGAHRAKKIALVR
jgi:2-polyprenyl-3-methyl-5-hydroxy-6-metoxy-1,4-benzoquinol methylase